MHSFITNHLDIASLLSRSAERLVAMLRFGMVATVLYWLMSGKLLWALVGTVCTVLTYLPAISIQDPVMRAATALCLTLMLFAHVVFGMQAGLYESSNVYDKAIHALGCGGIAGLVIAAISRYCALKRIRLPRPLFLLLTAGVVISLGTIWELFEFAIDRTGLFQAQKGLTDTMLDLVADALGALFAIIAFVLFPRHTIAKTG